MSCLPTPPYLLPQGVLHVSLRNPREAVVQVGNTSANSALGRLVRVSGRQACNRALHGDTVVGEVGNWGIGASMCCRTLQSNTVVGEVGNQGPGASLCCRALQSNMIIGVVAWGFKKG